MAALTAGGLQAAEPGRQHLKVEGPGQRPDAYEGVRWCCVQEEDGGRTVLPEAQAEEKRQFPPVPQEVLVQHLMSAASLGQAPET